MDDHDALWSTTGDGLAQGRDGKGSGHPVRGRVPDDPSSADVFDAADVELALSSGMLGKVREPDPVPCQRGEVPPHEVVVNRRTRTLAGTPSALGRRGRPDAVLRAKTPDPSFGCDMPSALELIGDEAMSELGVVGMHVPDGVHQVGVVPVAIGDRITLPPVEGLGREAQHRTGTAPTPGRAGRSFWERIAGEIGGRTLQDLVLHRQATVLTAEPHDLGLF